MFLASIRNRHREQINTLFLQLITGGFSAMAQLERTRRSSDSPRLPQSQTSPTFEQLLRVEETQYWSPSTSPTFEMNHDQEGRLSPAHNKKSVLAKVKERAKKLRHTLSGRTKHESETNDDHSAPPRGVTLNDNDVDDKLDEDPEYLGAPMYESEAAPENLKETARQHPRAVPVISDNHKTPNSMNCEVAEENDRPVTPNPATTEVVSGKLAPAYSAMSDATHKIVSKIAGLTIATTEAQGTEKVHTQVHGGAGGTSKIRTQIQDAGQEAASNAAQNAIPQHTFYEAKAMGENSGHRNQYGATSPHMWDKGVSVKEYFMNKLQPGEDERALSQAITEAISPRKSTGDTGMVEKVKEAVASFFWHEEPSNTVAKTADSSSSLSSNIPSYSLQNRVMPAKARSSEIYYPASSDSSSLIPISTDAQKVIDEENHGKILQPN